MNPNQKLGTYDFFLQVSNVETMISIRGESLPPEFLSRLAEVVCYQFDACREKTPEELSGQLICKDPLETVTSSARRLLQLLPRSDRGALELMARMPQYHAPS